MSCLSQKERITPFNESFPPDAFYFLFILFIKFF